MHSDSIDRVVDPESKGHTKTTTSVTISANHYTTTSVTTSHLRATISPDTRRYAAAPMAATTQEAQGAKRLQPAQRETMPAIEQLTERINEYEPENTL